MGIDELIKDEIPDLTIPIFMDDSQKSAIYGMIQRLVDIMDLYAPERPADIFVNYIPQLKKTVDRITSATVISDLQDLDEWVGNLENYDYNGHLEYLLKLNSRETQPILSRDRL
jgi:hypothetical protein